MDNDWFTDQQFWKDFEPLMFNRDRINRTGNEVSDLIKLAEINENSSGLDTFCGYGRYSHAFARRGFPMTGVDITPEYIETARKTAEEKKLQASFVCADMREYRADKSFDFALNLYTSLGYMDDPDDEDQILRHIYDSLRAGGCLIIETLGKECYAMNPQKNEWFEQDGYTVLVETRPVLNWTRLENHWIFYLRGERKEFTFRHGLYSALEMGQMLGEAGFAEVDFFGSFGGRPYDENAKTLIAVAKKA